MNKESLGKVRNFPSTIFIFIFTTLMELIYNGFSKESLTNQ